MADRIGDRRPGDDRAAAPYLGRPMVQSAAAGYDASVAGLDEVSARSALAAMQDRLARDPTSALGLGTNATAAELRAAFLQLTKQYHPVRFGRMALDIQKLSNEVFLALRAAHDTLAKGLRQAAPVAAGRGPTPSALGSQVMAPAPAPGHAPAAGRSLQPIPAKPPRTANDSGERLPVGGRTPTPVTGVRVSASRPPASQPPSIPRPPPSHPSHPSHPGSTGQSGPARLASGPVSPAGTAQPAAPAASRGDEAAALDLLQRQQWDQARSVLHQLSARDPSSKRIRALMCYARGREAQLDRRVDDARVELQDAIELDPDLQLAKTALTELFTRRK